METRTFEFQLDGEVSVERFYMAVDAWRSTFNHLSKSVGTKNIVGDRISDLQGGSAISSTEVMFEDFESAEEFTRLYEETALRARGDIRTPPPEQIRVPVDKLIRAAAADSGEGLVWRSPGNDYLIVPILRDNVDMTSYSSDQLSVTTESIGVVSGRLESLSARQGLRAVIYDHIFDKAVRFTLAESMKDKVRDMWDKPVEAVGTIRRDVRSGRPLSIHDIRTISLDLPHDDPWAWKNAKGALKHLEPGVPTEELIRRIWDE